MRHGKNPIRVGGQSLHRGRPSLKKSTIQKYVTKVNGRYISNAHFLISKKQSLIERGLTERNNTS